MKKAKIIGGITLASVAFSVALTLSVKYQSAKMFDSNYTLDNIMALSQTESSVGKGSCIFYSVTREEVTTQEYTHRYNEYDDRITINVTTERCEGTGTVCGVCGTTKNSIKSDLVTCNNYCKP